MIRNYSVRPSRCGVLPHAEPVVASTRGRDSERDQLGENDPGCGLVPPPLVTSYRPSWQQLFIADPYTLSSVDEVKDDSISNGGVFTSSDPRRIAQSLKRSAKKSRCRKARPFQSAMSMLNLYINQSWPDASCQ